MFEITKKSNEALSNLHSPHIFTQGAHLKEVPNTNSADPFSLSSINSLD